MNRRWLCQPEMLTRSTYYPDSNTPTGKRNYETWDEPVPTGTNCGKCIRTAPLRDEWINGKWWYQYIRCWYRAVWMNWSRADVVYVWYEEDDHRNRFGQLASYQYIFLLKSKRDSGLSTISLCLVFRYYSQKYCFPIVKKRIIRKCFST